jgi:NAD(P)H dehydrogenase (quinone)
MVLGLVAAVALAHGSLVKALGMILVGVPYSVQELFTTQGGGSPYGPGHVAGGDNQRGIDPHEAAICRALGRRLAEVGLRLQTK